MSIELFLSVNVYLSLISMLLSRDQSLCILFIAWAAFLRRLSRISVIGGYTLERGIALAIHCAIDPTGKYLLNHLLYLMK